MEQANKKNIVTFSMVLGIISSIMIFVGMFLPVIDLSHFYSTADFQYDFFKVCKNVGYISSMWKAIPVGFILAAAFMFILSFVKIPILKILPCILAVALFIMMLVDVSNVVEWIKDFIDRFIENQNQSLDITAGDVLGSLMIGLYTIICGIVVGLVSCFTTKK